MYDMNNVPSHIMCDKPEINVESSHKVVVYFTTDTLTQPHRLLPFRL